MYISAFPTLSLKDIFSLKKNPEFDRLFGGSVHFYYRGANAIFNLIKSLDLKPDENILVPCYNCGIEVEAIIAGGASVQFYGLKGSLEADLDDLAKKADGNTRGVFIIHYFGFPQSLTRLKEFCAAKKIYLIEDCAHAFLSRWQGAILGRFGDFGIFSFQKSLAVGDGGALVVNNGLEIKKTAGRAVSTASTLRGVAVLCLEHLKFSHAQVFKILDVILFRPGKLLWRALKRVCSKSLQVTTASSRNFDATLVTAGISKISYRLAASHDYQKIFEKRRENFLYLVKRLKDNNGIKLIFQDLPDGVCPLFLPLWVENRDALQERFSNKGLETFIFGKTPHPLLSQSEFPFAYYCTEHNLCLPIHQDLSREHLDFIAQVVGEEV